jgi:hypothetical protein
LAPLPYLLEAAIILQLFLKEYFEAGVAAGLLVFNATLGLLHEGRARATIEALKSRLALSAWVRRDGAWKEIPASQRSLSAGWKIGIDEGEQIALGRRFLQHLLDAELLRLGENGRGRSTGDEEDGDHPSLATQSGRKFKTRHLRHVLVEDHADRARRTVFEESQRRRVDVNLMADYLENEFEGIEHSGIIVHNRDGSATIVRHPIDPAACRAKKSICDKGWGPS